MAIGKQIIFGDALKELGCNQIERYAVIITDSNVNRIYCDNLFGNAKMIVLGPGERAKTMRTIGRIYSKLIEYKADRHTVIVAVGGGVVCDTAGFAAATFKRGTGLVLVPTTLLAQADAAIGGKNGVNVSGFKNLAGTFRQPDRTIIDTKFLKTLDRKNFNNGTAEIIKTAAIYDSAFFGSLERKALFELTGKQLESVIKKSVGIKNAIVREDPEEKGIRKILNFGHTIGHALELNIRNMHHGEAVSVGMAAACAISQRITGLSQEDAFRILNILKLNRLPVRIPETVSTKKLMESIVQDKKKSGGSIDLVLLENIGNPVIKNMEIKEIEGIINDIR